MSNNASIYVRANKTLFVTLLLVSGMGVANAAWTPAPGNPPGSNAAEPLNVSATTQTKSGELLVTNWVRPYWFQTYSSTYLATQAGAVKVGTGNTPAASSVLDVESTTRGFLPPRMTTAQRNAIASPVEGLTIYNTETDGLDVYTGSLWKSLAGGSGGDSSAGVPTGAVMFFDGACPSLTEWQEYTALNGRYVVGATGARAVGASATGGTTALGDRATRVAGAHTHGYSDSYYGGYASVAFTPGPVNYGYVFAYHNQNSIYNPGVSFNKSTVSAGVEETPAPYLQLRPCKKL